MARASFSTYATVQDLRDEQPPLGDDQVFVAFVAYTGKFYKLDRTSTALDDGETVIKPTVRATAQSGRYLTSGSEQPGDFEHVKAALAAATSSVDFNSQKLTGVGVPSATPSMTGTTAKGSSGEAAMSDHVHDITVASLSGVHSAVVADDAVIGGTPVVHVVAIADGATADKDVVLVHKTRILLIEVHKGPVAGGVGDKLRVKNVANAITDDMSLDVATLAANGVLRPATYDTAKTTIAAGTALRITKTKASAADVACTVIIIGIRVA